MILVVLVHVLYWGKFFSNYYVKLLQSFLLFEMPFMFFITGASNSFSKTENYFSFLWKRLKRILIPYWIFALICVALSILRYSIEGAMDFLTGIRILVSWLIPVDTQITSIESLTWALWYVPVYICVVITIPLLKRLRQSKWKIEFSFLLAGLFATTSLLNLGWVQNVAFYTYWTYIGLFYLDIKSAAKEAHKRKYFICVAVVMAALLFALRCIGQSLNMQSNKFPPNLIFFVFSMMMMSLIMWLVPYTDPYFAKIENCKVISKVFERYSTYSMTIYLYQVFVFNLTIPMVELLIPDQGGTASVAKAMLCLLMSIFLCASLPFLFGSTERLGSGALKANNREDESSNFDL